MHKNIESEVRCCDTRKIEIAITRRQSELKSHANRRVQKKNYWSTVFDWISSNSSDITDMLDINVYYQNKTEILDYDCFFVVNVCESPLRRGSKCSHNHNHT